MCIIRMERMDLERETALQALHDKLVAVHRHDVDVRQQEQCICVYVSTFICAFIHCMCVLRSQNVSYVFI